MAVPPPGPQDTRHSLLVVHLRATCSPPRRKGPATDGPYHAAAMTHVHATRGRTSHMRSRLARIIGLVLAASLLSTLAAAGTAHAAKAKLAPATLTAGGATFPLGFYQVAIGEFKLQQKGVTINYTGVG